MVSAFLKCGKVYSVAQNVVCLGECSLRAWKECVCCCDINYISLIDYICLIDYAVKVKHVHTDFMPPGRVYFLQKGVEVSNYKNGLIFLLAVVSFLRYIVWCSVVRYITLRIAMFSCRIGFIIMCNCSLSWYFPLLWILLCGKWI